MAKIIHSGAALGADSEFDRFGTQYGFKVIHHSFEGHNYNKQVVGQIQKHDQQELEKGQSLLQDAKDYLGRTKKQSDYVENLLLRNYYQIKDSQLIVAVSEITNLKRCHVKGGTGYAVAMGILKKMPIVVFDQKREKWFYSLNGEKFKELKRLPDINRFPEQFAGIGTRQITNTAIKQLKTIFINIETV